MASSVRRHGSRSCGVVRDARPRGRRADGSPIPLPGSTFQGADGDQANEPAASIDWDALEAPGTRGPQPTTPTIRTRSSRAARRRATRRTGRSTRQPDGVTPGKANILDAWSAVDQPSGRTFLYLAFARNAPSGDTFLAFELNQTGRTWMNAERLEGPVPARRRRPRVATRSPATPRTCSCGAGAPAIDRPRDRMRPDRARSCRSPRVTDDVEAQGAINPGRSTTTSRGISGDEIPAFRFGEAALDLDALLGPEFAHGCYAFSSIWMHSRSSHVLHVADAGLRRAAGDRSAHLRGRGDEVLRPRRRRRARRERARASPASRSSPTTTTTGSSTPASRPRSATATGATCSTTSAARATGCASGSCRPAGARRTTGDARSRTRAPTAASGAGPGLPCGWGPIDPGAGAQRDRARTSATGTRRS